MSEGSPGKAIGCGYSIPSGAIGKLICSGRYWSADSPDGYFPEYAITLLALLSDPLVKRCWYIPLDGGYRPAAISAPEVHAMLDTFMASNWPRR